MVVVSFLIAAISMGVVYLYGCIGETITEKAGSLNLGIPGIMSLGALGGAIGVNVYYAIFGTDSSIGILIVLFGILFSCIFSALGGLIFAFLTVTLQSNQNVTGLVLTTFGVALMKFIGSAMNKDNFVKASSSFKFLFGKSMSEGNWFCQLFLGHGILVYLAFIVALLTWVFLKYSKTGLFLRSVGESPATADAQGINVSKYKYLSILAGSAIAGLGGLYYVFDRSGGTTFVEATIESFGWLAVALVIFSMWKPGIGVLGSILFGALYILPTQVNVSNVQLKVFAMFPYIATVLILVFNSIFDSKNSQPPASLGINYFREER